jgi:hypothetical protein
MRGDAEQCTHSCVTVATKVVVLFHIATSVLTHKLGFRASMIIIFVFTVVIPPSNDIGEDALGKQERHEEVEKLHD